MQVENLKNKYKIFQDYYFQVNGEIISYSEALRLYSELDNDTKLDFEKFYEDETGYEIISSNGYGLDSAPKLKFDENGKLIVKSTKTSSKNQKTVNTYETTSSASKKAAINIKYNLEAFAKKTGKILDPQWSVYSAEEIMQMYNDGVNIPQDIVDLANSILQTTGANVEGTDENPDGAEETTEKEPYLDLIPKAQEKIEKCEETNDKLESYINKIIPEQQKQEKNAKASVKKQRQTLDEYQNKIKEYTKLQNKIQNGEVLTDKEAKRYEDLSKVLGTEKNENGEFEINKTKLSIELNDVNIVAVLGEKLADETIEVGNTLADYTSKTNYKATAKTIMNEVGLIGGSKLMNQGKVLAKEANKIGNDTKEYTVQTEEAIDNIAETLDIKDELSSKDAILSGDAQVSTEQPADSAEKENRKENKQKMPAFVTDKFVLDLIQEGKTINADLYKQILIAITQTKNARKDIVFADKADKRISVIVDAFAEAEAKRQEEIAKTEQENEKKAQEKEDIIEKAKKHTEEENNTNPNNVNPDKVLNKSNDDKEIEPEFTAEERKKIETIDSEIAGNNKKIEDIKTESAQHREQVKNDTSKEKTTINKSMPIEQQAQKINQAYQEKDLPEHNERMDFINDAGAILAQIGTAETVVGTRLIIIGHSLLSNIFTMNQGIMMITLGSLTLTKGLVSIAIGLNAKKVSDDESLIDKADEKTDVAGANIDRSIKDLSAVDKKIIDITEQMSAGQEDGEDNTTSGVEAQDDTAGNAEEGAKDTGAGTTSTSPSLEAQTTSTPEAQTAPAQAPMQQAPAEAPATDAITTENGEKTSEDKVNANTTADIEKATSNATTTVSDGKKETPEQKEEEKEISAASSATTSSSSNENSNKKEEMSTDNADKVVKDAKKSAKDDAKDSEKVKKDTEKTTQQLEKETKSLKKQMKKDQKEIEKMTKQSERAAKKQAELLTEYEELVAENERLTAEEANKPQPQQSTALGSSQFSIQGAQQGATPVATMGGDQPQESDNQTKIQNNDARLAEIGIAFNTSGKIITRNRSKIIKLQKSSKKSLKKLNKKTKIINQKNKEAEKKEQAKQKKLAKQLAIVGVAENVFSITLSVGTILAAIPYTATVGAMMVKIGTAGIIDCGLTKGAINIANGNLTAGLMAIGQAVITAVASQVGGGEAINNVLTQASAGLSVVASSAEMVNNVRTLQGKEASGLFSKISTIAGAASAVAGIAGSFANGTKIVKDAAGNFTTEAAKSAFSTAGTFGKITQIASAVGSVTSNVGQVMTEFGGESNASKLLGLIGTGISTVASVASMANAKKEADSKDQDNKDQDNKNQETDKTKEADKSKTDSKKKTAEEKRAEKQARKEAKAAEKKAKADAKKAEKQARKDAKAREKQQKEAQLKEAKNAKNDKKEEAKNSDLSSKEKKNMTENGASKEYANVSDEDLAERIEVARENGDDELANKLNAEMTNRGEYKEKMNLISAAKTEKSTKNSETFSKISDGIGKGMQLASSVLNMGNKQQQQGQQKKKGYVSGSLTKRTKEIIKKNKKRIKALAKNR